MPTYTVPYSNIGTRLSEANKARFNRVVKSIRREVHTAGLAIVQDVISREVPIPVNTANYRRGWQARDLDTGAVIYNDVPYAAIIEGGRRPGARMPPVQIILDWVRKKRIGNTFIGPIQPTHGPRPSKGQGRRLTARQDTVERQQWWISLQIARAIAKRGIRGRHIMTKTKTRLDPIVQEAVLAALRSEGVT